MRVVHNGSFGKKHVKFGKFRSAAKTKKRKTRTVFAVRVFAKDWAFACWGYANPDHHLFFLVGLFVVLVFAVAVFFLTFALFLIFMVASAAVGLGRNDRGDNKRRGEEK